MKAIILFILTCCVCTGQPQFSVIDNEGHLSVSIINNSNDDLLIFIPDNSVLIPIFEDGHNHIRKFVTFESELLNLNNYKMTILTRSIDGPDGRIYPHSSIYHYKIYCDLLISFAIEIKYIYLKDICNIQSHEFLFDGLKSVVLEWSSRKFKKESLDEYIYVDESIIVEPALEIEPNTPIN